MKNRKWVLWLWLGVLVDVGGVLWDGIHHSLNPELDWETIPVQHYPLIIGPIITFFVAIQIMKAKEYTYRWIAYLVILLAAILLIGTLWDNFGYHIRGIEPEVWALPHIFVKLGTFGTLLSAVAASLGGMIYKYRKVRRTVSRAA